jgi:cytoskeletal protein RodZ
VSIGDTLAAARHAAGLTIARVSELTRIREAIVRGIERDDFSACGGDIYARGHIRSIGRVTGADAESLVSEYDALHGAPRAVDAAAVFAPSTPIRLATRRGLNWSAVMVLALVVIAGFAVHHVLASPGATQGAAQAAASARAAGSRPPASPGHPAGPGHRGGPGISRHAAGAHRGRRAMVIRLAASDDCWVQLRTAHGRTIFSGVIPAGSGRHWTERRTVQLRLGNPAGVALTVNGRRLRSRHRPAGRPLTLRPGHRPKATD